MAKDDRHHSTRSSVLGEVVALLLPLRGLLTCCLELQMSLPGQNIAEETSCSELRRRTEGSSNTRAAIAYFTERVKQPPRLQNLLFY